LFAKFHKFNLSNFNSSSHALLFELNIVRYSTHLRDNLLNTKTNGTTNTIKVYAHISCQ